LSKSTHISKDGGTLHCSHRVASQPAVPRATAAGIEAAASSARPGFSDLCGGAAAARPRGGRRVQGAAGVVEGWELLLG